MRSNSAVALSSSLFSFCDDDELRRGFRRTGVRFTDRKRVRTFMRVGRFRESERGCTKTGERSHRTRRRIRRRKQLLQRSRARKRALEIYARYF